MSLTNDPNCPDQGYQPEDDAAEIHRLNRKNEGSEAAKLYYEKAIREAEEMRGYVKPIKRRSPAPFNCKDVLAICLFITAVIIMMLASDDFVLFAVALVCSIACMCLVLSQLLYGYKLGKKDNDLLR